MAKKKIIGNYITREAMGDAIVKKLKANKPLTDEEKEMVIAAVTDPLEEFCRREGTFRLVEILDVDPTDANKLEDEATQAIRDTIDCNDLLYDDMDAALEEMMEENTNG